MRRSHHGLGWILCVWAPLAASTAPPEAPRAIGSIDFFGLRNLDEAAIRKHLPFREGEPLVDRQHRPDAAVIARAAGVDRVTLAYVCCTQDQEVMVYVGVAEKPVPPTSTSTPAFTGSARLPDALIRTYEQFEAQVQASVHRGQAIEDHSQGHPLAEYPPLRAVQLEFIEQARTHGALLSQVLTTATDARHRAVAAQILGYTSDKRIAADLLARAVHDPDGTVRNNVTRALGVIAGYSAAHPDLGIRIDPAPFVAMLNSVVWTDLNKGIMVLVSLTASREPGLLRSVDQGGRTALIDMCRWKNPGHSLPACMVLRRIEGLPDVSGPDDRPEVLRKVGAL